MASGIAEAHEADGPVAVFSLCRTWRYVLHRGRGPKAICWIMLNPSTADEERNDPTVERVCRRSWALGYDRVVVCNLFALRSTDPRHLYEHPTPIGPENDAHIFDQARKADTVVLAWGNHGRLMERGTALAAMLHHHRIEPLYALGVTKACEPRHPLYVPYSRELEVV